MTSSCTRYLGASLVLTALLAVLFALAPAATVSAQVVTDPRIAEFDPSPDHWAVLDSGDPAVSGYELGVYMLEAAEPFTTVDMGKPSPDADGKIRYDFSSGVAGWPLPGGNYEARVRAVGPEGAALSDASNPFTFTASPPCTITLSATSARVPAAGGAYTVDVATGAGCAWAVTTSLSWVTLWSTGGSGSGTAPFEVQANPLSSSRAGTVTIGGKTVTLTQDAASSTTKLTPYLSWATPAAITQGTPLGPTQLNAAAKFAGTFVYSPPAGTVLAAGTHTLRVTFTPDDTALYNSATASRTLVVNPATKIIPYISWPAPAAITQGTPIGATQLNATTGVSGTFVYSPPAGTVLAAGTHTLSATFTPADPTRYATAIAAVVLVVNAPAKLTPYLSWATPADITQGTPLGPTQLNAAAKFAGTFVYSPPAGTVLAAGTHTLSVTFTPADTALYNTATASRTIVVEAATKLTPYISWPTPAAITQGTPLGAAQLNAAAKFAGTFAYSPPAGTVLAAGTHTLRVTFTPADPTRYNTATATTALVVNPPPS